MEICKKQHKITKKYLIIIQNNKYLIIIQNKG